MKTTRGTPGYMASADSLSLIQLYTLAQDAREEHQKDRLSTHMCQENVNSQKQAQ